MPLDTSARKCTQCRKVFPEEEFVTLKMCKHCSARIRAYRQTHKISLAEKQKAYKQKNKDKIAIKQRAYYVANKERIDVRKKAYYATNKERFNRQAAIREKAVRRGEKGPLAQCRIKTAHLIRESLRQQKYTKRSRTHQLLGCSYQELLAHLGPKPCEDAHIDHICPCAQARSQQELELLQHHWNLRWLPALDNLYKGSEKTPEGEELCQVLLGRHWV